uniref:MH2 domain-containing protein n=1 Tax=Lepeophtheirus salmonis TaxID=72036 RepID=A0A0K2TUL2_LEPSM
MMKKSCCIPLFKWCKSFLLRFDGRRKKKSQIDSFPWCKLAYWEECLRVGPQFPVFDSSVDVFSEFLKGSGLSLSSIFTQNKNPSSSTRETRKKIGRGLSLSQESNGVWIHNKSSSAIFVNSPTLDFHPLTGKFIIHKLLPGHSLLVFDYGVSQPLLKRRNNSAPRLDVCSVRVSFAKGWGANYKRQNVTNCPCWLEIMLQSPPPPPPIILPEKIS